MHFSYILVAFALIANVASEEVVVNEAAEVVSFEVNGTFIFNFEIYVDR